MPENEYLGMAYPELKLQKQRIDKRITDATQRGAFDEVEELYDERDRVQEAIDDLH